MDIIFLLIAVSPALIATGIEFKGKEISWQRFLTKFAGWFYWITLFDMLILYLRGWSSFDFTVFSVQFLDKYMILSTVIALLLYIGKKIVNEIYNAVNKG